MTYFVPPTVHFCIPPDPKVSFNMHINDCSQLLRKVERFSALSAEESPEIVSLSLRHWSSKCALNHADTRNLAGQTSRSIDV
jgi:hypothetical protein